MTQNGTPRKTPPKRRDVVLIMHLAAGLSVEKAAQAANVSRTTANRRMKQPDFQARIQEARAEFAVGAASRLGSMMARACDVLDRLLNSRTARIRLAAADRILGLGWKLRHEGELQERISGIERHLGIGKKP
jgi:hypothetical protein